jgi:S-adenosylmethionine synthetase
MSSRKNYLFTSESVSEGHPDKVCDRISDSIVDLMLGYMPEARIALETLATTNRVVLAGEVRGPEAVGHDQMIESARMAIKDIGYDQEGFDWRKARIECLVHAQSEDIAVGVDAAGNKDEGAGDQGIMFGYACRETDELMPAPIHYSHRILKAMNDARKSGKAKELLPDAKPGHAAIRNGKPVRAAKIARFDAAYRRPRRRDVRAIVKPYRQRPCPPAGCAR